MGGGGLDLKISDIPPLQDDIYWNSPDVMG